MRQVIKQGLVNSIVALAAAVFLTPAAAFADELAGYQYYVVGNPENVERETSGLVVMQGGGDDVDENYVEMARLGGGGDFVVLRASQADEYNDYIFKLCNCDSVETIVFENGDAANERGRPRRKQDRRVPRGGMGAGTGDEGVEGTRITSRRSGRW